MFGRYWLTLPSMTRCPDSFIGSGRNRDHDATNSERLRADGDVWEQFDGRVRQMTETIKRGHSVLH